jgi:hypothetical protein
MKTTHALVLLVSALLLSSNSAFAAAFVIDDTNPNDTVTISLNDFERGFLVNGNLVQQGLNNSQSVTLPEAGPITFSGSWIDLGQSGAGSRTIYLVEASDPTLISDIFQYSWSTDGQFGTIQGSFVSDVNDNLGHVHPGTPDVFIENGQGVPFSLPFLGGEIHSDAEVPEGGSLSFLPMGLAAIALFARRFRKQVKA